MLTVWLIIVIALGALSIAYGVITAKDVLSRDPGNERMQEIAKAIQEGASAYLKRQYTTIAIVGGVLFVLESRGTRRGQARGALRRLKVGRARLLGAVLTKFNAKSTSYGGYDYAYDYNYGAGPDAEAKAPLQRRLPRLSVNREARDVDYVVQQAHRRSGYRAKLLLVDSRVGSKGSPYEPG